MLSIYIISFYLFIISHMGSLSLTLVAALYLQQRDVPATYILKREKRWRVQSFSFCPGKTLAGPARDVQQGPLLAIDSSSGQCWPPRQLDWHNQDRGWLDNFFFLAFRSEKPERWKKWENGARTIFCPWWTTRCIQRNIIRLTPRRRRKKRKLLLWCLYSPPKNTTAPTRPPDHLHSQQRINHHFFPSFFSSFSTLSPPPLLLNHARYPQPSS